MKRFKILFLVIALMAAMLVSVPAAAGEKVTICHKPDTPAEVTITVSVNALDAHLAHDDYVGECTDVLVLTCPFEAAIPVIGPDLVMYVVENPTEHYTNWCMSTSDTVQDFYLWGVGDDTWLLPGFEVCYSGPPPGEVSDMHVGQTDGGSDFTQNISCALVP